LKPPTLSAYFRHLDCQWRDISHTSARLPMKTHRPLPENNNPIAIWAAKNSVKLVKAFYPANFTYNKRG